MDRSATTLMALEVLRDLGATVLVECGSLREGVDDGSGTTAWAAYCRERGGHLWTVDLDPAATAFCRQQVDPVVCTTVHQDAREFLARFDRPIDFLYLDATDCFVPGYKEAHRQMYQAATFADRAVLLIDDWGFDGRGGKGELVVSLALADGFVPVAEGYQLLLVRGPGRAGPVATSAAMQAALEAATARRAPHPLPSARLALGDAPRLYAELQASPPGREYLSTVLELCPRGEGALEAGFGSGLSSIWLSRRGVSAEGIEPVAERVEWARQANEVLAGTARFQVGELLDLPQCDRGRYAVIHHHGVVDHYDAAVVRAVLAAQVMAARWVVFTVPSVYYPSAQELGHERRLPLEVWRQLLEPFAVEDLRYYGHPAHAAREHLLAVLRGQAGDQRLRTLVMVPADPYPDGLSAVVHTRNEAQRLDECLDSLRGWTDELIVCDMESADDTLAIAARHGAAVVQHPLIPDFDRARNVSAMCANYRWILYLDADERVPAALGRALRELVASRGHSFEALLLPFRHHFAGRWMRSLYPGYTSPRLLKNGRFVFRAALHSGADVDGRVVPFPAADPELAIVHYSYDSCAHYLEKLNRYTDGEAEAMHRRGQQYDWRAAVRHLVQDFRAYYDEGGASRDGVHGFLYSFFGGFYRFEQHAKLYERRYRDGLLQAPEEQVPSSVEEVLTYALAAARERPLASAAPIRVGTADDAAVLWSGPLDDPSGYGEESRQFVLGLDAGDASLAVRVLPWSADRPSLDPAAAARLQHLAARPVRPGFVHIVQNFAPAFGRDPRAVLQIGRTMFETDRLPPDWVKGCNRMDAVWVPSEFNRRTFAAAGVAAERIQVIPGCLDPAPYLALPVRDRECDRPFRFLAVFDWTWHKGWDVLLQGFLEAFEGRQDVELVLKVWSTLGYGPEGIRQQAAAWTQEQLAYDVLADPRIRFLQRSLPAADLPAFYREADAYVLPSRGEGWGRPYLEAMACGLPTIGTRWSGNTAFMTDENSFLVDALVVDVPEAGWREVPAYRGHRWAEPNLPQFITALRHVVAERADADRRAQQARQEVLSRFDRRRVAGHIAAAIEELRERTAAHPATASATPKVGIRWEGAVFRWHSLAHVNRELCLGLLDDDTLELAIVPWEAPEFEPTAEPGCAQLAALCGRPLGCPVKVHVRHYFPPRFERPAEGHLVLVQPWEYGYLPQAWIAPIRENVSEVWCYSTYVRDVYRRSGVPEELLAVLPLGVDAKVFSPEAPPFVPTQEPGARSLGMRSQRPFVFAFVGGSLARKGIDILLAAWRQAFTPLDEVLLLVKDSGTRTVYRGQHYAERVLALADDPTAAPVVYLDADLSPHELAGVYTAADCLVAPYRGEGFLLPALEAMACGRPVVVTAGGPTDDFVDPTVGWQVPAAQRPLQPSRVGDWDLAGAGWQLEVDPGQLARLLRSIAQDPAEAARRGTAARAKVIAGWTWAHSHQVLRERLAALAARPDWPAAPVSRRGRRRAPASRTTSGRRAPTGITLCMIVRNEERVLANALASAQPWVDELVVVDTGSDDATAAIAAAHGARVVHFPWCDDFSAARNESLRHATREWIFWMDADDVLPAACGQQLRPTVRRADDQTFGLLLQVHCPPAPGQAGLTVVDHVKLFRNLPSLRFEGRIHEQILASIQRAGGLVERTDLYVVHAGYDHSPAGQDRKRERDLRLLELDLAERPDHPFVLFNIGMTAFHMRDWSKAEQALERCLAVSGPRESTLRKIFAMLAASRQEQGDLDGARRWIDQGLGQYPRDPELLFRAGAILRESGELAAAEQAYRALLTARDAGHLDSLDITILGFKARHNMALVLRDQGRCDLAVDEFRAALADRPTFAPAWFGLAETLGRLGRHAEARAALAHAQALPPASS